MPAAAAVPPPRGFPRRRASSRPSAAAAPVREQIALAPSRPPSGSIGRGDCRCLAAAPPSRARRFVTRVARRRPGRPDRRGRVPNLGRFRGSAYPVGPGRPSSHWTLAGAWRVGRCGERAGVADCPRWPGVPNPTEPVRTLAGAGQTAPGHRLPAAGVGRPVCGCAVRARGWVRRVVAPAPGPAPGGGELPDAFRAFDVSFS
jgi:hypothetical protein